MEENILEKLDLHQLGRELQRARTKRGLTQAEAAQILNVARTTITAIEKGERRIKPDELIKLARAYGRPLNDFTRPRPAVEPFQAQFRGPYLRNLEEDGEVKKYIDELEDLSRDYLELERLTNSPLVMKYPPEYTIKGLRIDRAAEDVANQERKRLGLGDGPIPILRDILEQDVGLRIFYLPIQPSKYSAIYLYDHELGGCIAVNRLHPEERRRWSLAHDYGHFLAHRYNSTMFVINNYQRVPQDERFADYFAACFLMPASGLTMRFNDIRKTKEKIVVADLCILAHYYGVSVEAMTVRLEDLKLVPTGIWEKLQRGNFKIREAQAELGLGEIPCEDSELPIRYQNLTVIAFQQGLITEGRLSGYLRADRLSARNIVEKLGKFVSQESDLGTEVELNLMESIND
jgi:Zn-dependent peptidase ImmA (M78 family)/transcriptional regulator with XRE-family HTH domain